MQARTRNRFVCTNLMLYSTNSVFQLMSSFVVCTQLLLNVQLFFIVRITISFSVCAIYSDLNLFLMRVNKMSKPQLCNQARKVSHNIINSYLKVKGGKGERYIIRTVFDVGFVHTFIVLVFHLSLACAHIGEECELTCRESNNDVVILPSNMTAESVLKEHWRNPHKVKVSLSVCSCLPHSSDRRTSQSSVIHNCPVRNFTYSVYILALLDTMQNPSMCWSFMPSAMQMFVLEA